MIIVNEDFRRKITNEHNVVSLAKLKKVVEEDAQYKAGRDCFFVPSATKTNPLHVLAEYDDLRPFKYMFKNIAKCSEWINQRDISGRSPIDIALVEGNKMAVTFLWQNGATVLADKIMEVNAIKKEMEQGDYKAIKFKASEFSSKTVGAASKMPSGSASRASGLSLSGAASLGRFERK